MSSVASSLTTTVLSTLILTSLRSCPLTWHTLVPCDPLGSCSPENCLSPPF
jgi:hypothetical protein